VVCNTSNTTGATCGAGTDYLSGAPAFNGVRVARSLGVCVMFCRSLFDNFLFVIVLSFLLRFAASDYSFGIFKPFLDKIVLYVFFLLACIYKFALLTSRLSFTEQE
jgi:hypothetical protein